MDVVKKGPYGRIMREIDTVDIAGVAIKILHRNQQQCLSLVFLPKEKRKMKSILN
jgi:hypothetical protein